MYSWQRRHLLDERTDMGIRLFPLISSGRTVKSCKSAGTIEGVWPNDSMRPGTAFCHSGIWSANPDNARHICINTTRGPAAKVLKAVRSESRRPSRCAGSTCSRSNVTWADRALIKAQIGRDCRDERTFARNVCAANVLVSGGASGDSKR